MLRAAVVAVLVGTIVTIALRWLCRLLVGWRRVEKWRRVRITGDLAAFRSTPLTRHPGTFGLWTKSGHARVGDVVSDDGNTVVRRLETRAGSLQSGRGVLDGHIHASPDEVGAYREIVVDTPSGEAPAWLFGDPEATTWAIHIHGMNADRMNALRSVAAMSDHADTAHLVVSYRGDGEGPRQVGRATRLGLDEWIDVEAALAYSRRNGAQRILLVGWCLGATVALLLGDHSAHKDLLRGQILIAPATDWRALAQTASRRMKLPAPALAVELITKCLGSRPLCRLAGISEPIDFARLDWSGRRTVDIPTLVIHSRGDRTAPLSSSRRFADRCPSRVVLHETTPAAHTREYNVDPDGFSDAILDWLARL